MTKDLAELGRRLRRVRWLLVAIGMVVAVVPGSMAFGYFLLSGSNNAAARADTLVAGPKPNVAADARDVTVSWASTTTEGLAPASGYSVGRYATELGGAPVAVAAACAGTIAASTPTMSCVEHSVPNGTWWYGITPRLGTAWVGPEGARTKVTINGASFTINADQLVSGKGAPILGGVLTGFRDEEEVVFHLGAADGRVIRANKEEVGHEGSLANITFGLPGGVADATYVLVAVGKKGTVATSNAFRVDATPPVTTATQVPAAAVPPQSPWLNQSVIVTLSATDIGGLGVASIRYSAAGAQVVGATTVPITPTVQTATVTVANTGKTTLSFAATDKGGNVETTKTLVVQVDKVPPKTVIAFAPSPINGWVGPDASVAVSANDVGSGVGAIAYSINGGSDLAGPVTALPITANTDVTAHSTDIAGNAEPPVAASVKYDPTGPNATITPLPTTTVAGTVPLRAIVNDAAGDVSPGSGVASVQFERSVDANVGPWLPIGAPQTGASPNYSVAFDTSALPNGTYFLRVTTKDKVGNTSRSVLSTTGAAQAITVANLRASSLELVNVTGSVGRVDEGDKIIVGFDGPIAPASVCSALTTTSPIDLANAITVTLNDAGGNRNDTITVSAAAGTCTAPGLKLGTITLGSPNYLQGEDEARTANYAGADIHASTLAWDAATNKLTIKLGALTARSGRPRQVSAPTVAASYLPDSAITAAAVPPATTGTSILVVPVRTSGVAAIF